MVRPAGLSQTDYGELSLETSAANDKPLSKGGSPSGMDRLWAAE